MSPLFCGSGNFQLQEQDDQEFICSPSETPRKSRSPCSTPRKSKKSSKDSKNPYASRGLDKFSALLTELDEKRQKIYSKIGADEKTLVRFVYSSSNDCIPIVVKLKDQKQERSKIGEIKEKAIKKTATEENNKLSVEKLGGGGGDQKQIKQQQPRLETEQRTEKKVSNLQEWRRPYYMPVAIILILVFLIFGKSFAILCTSLGWYLVPALVPKTPMKKKKQAKRRSSEPKMMTEWLSSPRNHNLGVHKSWGSQEQEQHRKSF